MSEQRFTFTLRQLLISFALFAAAFGMMRYAVISASTLSAFVGAALIGAAAGAIVWRFWLPSVLAILVAAASYFTTGYIWDGGFPFCEIRLLVKDEDGRSVNNAVLMILDAGTGALAGNYPIAEHSAQGLLSDAQGRIVCHPTYPGQFSGYGWSLFWCIPIVSGRPHFQCQLSAEGCVPERFDVWRLFDSPYHSYDNFPKTQFVLNGTSVEMPIREQELTLRKAR